MNAVEMSRETNDAIVLYTVRSTVLRLRSTRGAPMFETYLDLKSDEGQNAKFTMVAEAAMTSLHRWMASPITEVSPEPGSAEPAPTGSPIKCAPSYYCFSSTLPLMYWLSAKQLHDG